MNSLFSWNILQEEDGVSHLAEQSSWDFAEKLHREVHQQFPSGKLGLEAFLKIRNILEPFCDFKGNHPLRGRFLVVSEPSYQWLRHFARKLNGFVQIPGHSSVLVNMGKEKSFLGAWSEFDFATRMTISGNACSFVRTGSSATPDMQVELTGKNVMVEITSMNRPEEEMRWVSVTSAVVTQVFQRGCIGGGVFGKVPNDTQLTEITEKLATAVNEAKEEDRMAKVVIPGLFRYYVAPKAKVSELPQQWRGHLAMWTSTPIAQKDKLAQIVRRKVSTQLSEPQIGALVVYDYFSGAAVIAELFRSPDIGLVIGPFPNLACVILIHSFGAYNLNKPKNGKRQDAEGATHFERPLPDGEAEEVIVWSNPMDGQEDIVQALLRQTMEFPQTLSRYLSN
jgi:hypothetical protein